MPVEARLKREDEDGNVVPYVVTEDPEVDNPTGYADPVVDFGARARLETLTEAFDGNSVIGYVGDITMVTAASGAMYIGGAGRIVLPDAGNVRGLLINPADSTRLIYITRMALHSSTAGYCHFRRDPTGGLPATAATVSNALLANVPPSLGRIGYDYDLSQPLAGGVDLGTVVGLTANVRVVLDLPPLILPPGHSWGFNVPYSQGADFACSIYWVERTPALDDIL